MNCKNQLLSLAIMEKAAECLRTIAHPHRLRIIEILLDHEESVGELARACELPSHMVSEHLRLLKDRGFLDNRREGRMVFYRIAEPALASIMHCVESRFGGRSEVEIIADNSSQPIVGPSASASELSLPA